MRFQKQPRLATEPNRIFPLKCARYPKMMIEITDKGRELIAVAWSTALHPKPKEILMPQRPTSILTTLAVSLLALTLI